MGILQKKLCTTAKKALAYRGTDGLKTDTAFHALRLGVVLYLPSFGCLNMAKLGAIPLHQHAHLRCDTPSTRVEWSQMSGRRTFGTYRPSLGAQVLALCSFIS